MRRPERRIVADNRKARHDYEVLETLEAGIELRGTEVKSLRAGRADIAEAFVKFEDGEAWLLEAHIAPYSHAAEHANHDPRRPRRLLLRRSEIHRWSRRARERGLTVVPLRLYFKGPWAKVEIALARGRRLHDKRQALREREDRRQMARVLRR